MGRDKFLAHNIFPGGSGGKEYICTVGDLGSIPGLGRSPGEGNGYPPTPVFWPGEFQGLYSPWGPKGSDTTECLLLSLSYAKSQSKQKHSKSFLILHMITNFQDIVFISIYKYLLSFAVVLLLNCVWLFVTPWTAACQAPLPFTLSQSLLKFMSIEQVMLFSLCHLFHTLLLLWIFPSIRVFTNESFLYIWWPKYWSFNNSLASEYSGLTSFRLDWFDLLAVWGILKSLIQCHNSKASILCYSGIFLVQLLHLYITARKTIAFTIQNFVSKICLCCLIQCLGLSQLSFEGASVF